MKLGFTQSLWLLVATTIVLFVVSLLMPSGFSAQGSGSAFIITELMSSNPDLAQIILFELRLPRASLALFVGASLGTCWGGYAGATAQSTRRTWSRRRFRYSRSRRDTYLLFRAGNNGAAGLAPRAELPGHCWQ
jgi:hypothetical protein